MWASTAGSAGADSEAAAKGQARCRDAPCRGACDPVAAEADAGDGVLSEGVGGGGESVPGQELPRGSGGCHAHSYMPVVAVAPRARHSYWAHIFELRNFVMNFVDQSHTGGIGQRFPVSGRILHPSMHH